MTMRVRLASLQLAVFLGGGLLAPVAHLAWHRPDHSHGRKIASDNHLSEGAAEARRTRGHARRELPSGQTTSHERLHAHPHPHPHAHVHVKLRATEASPPADPARTAPAAKPLETSHGHGSLAHFGLALLSAPPVLSLTPPSSTGLAPWPTRPRVAALFQPGFPLPRPPPVTLGS